MYDLIDIYTGCSAACKKVVPREKKSGKCVMKFFHLRLQEIGISKIYYHQLHRNLANSKCNRKLLHMEKILHAKNLFARSFIFKEMHFEHVKRSIQTRA